MAAVQPPSIIALLPATRPTYLQTKLGLLLPSAGVEDTLHGIGASWGRDICATVIANPRVWIVPPRSLIPDTPFPSHRVLLLGPPDSVTW